MTFRAWFRCSDGCDFRAELTEVVYRCPRCQGLLEVEHDLGALRSRGGAEWKALFDERFRLGPWPLGSGVWGKKEWVHPQLALANVVSMYEGGSPLLRLDRYARGIGLDHVWLKECGVTHTGSFKDLGMTVLVSSVREMQARGTPIRAVACASTGDTSAALAAYCAAAGIPAVVLLPRGKISTAQLVQPISNGALVLELDTDFDGCMRVVQDLSRTPDIYLANSMNSLRIEGQKTLSVEVAQQLGWTAPDWVVIPGGNLGNASAVGRGFLMMKELGLLDRVPRLVVAQAEAANPLYRAFEMGGLAGIDRSGGALRSPPAPPLAPGQPPQAGPPDILPGGPAAPPGPPLAPGQPPSAGPPLASARKRFTDLTIEPVPAGRTLATAIQIGNPVSARRALRALEALDGLVEQASEQELSDAAARADLGGAFACPHTAVALAALEKLAARGAIRRDERVVVVSTAHGLKFADFKVGYHEGSLPGVTSSLRNPSVKVAASLGAVQDAVAARFGRAGAGR